MKNFNRVFRSLQHMIFSLALIGLFLFVLKRVISLFLYRISDEAVLLEMLQIDFSELFLLGIFLIALFFGLFLLTSGVLLVAGMVLDWDKTLTHKRIVFCEKLFVALFPTFLLAGSLNNDSFVTITSMISFFAIFSFVFKSSIWDKV